MRRPGAAGAFAGLRPWRLPRLHVAARTHMPAPVWVALLVDRCVVAAPAPKCNWQRWRGQHVAVGQRCCSTAHAGCAGAVACQVWCSSASGSSYQQYGVIGLAAVGSSCCRHSPRQLLPLATPSQLERTPCFYAGCLGAFVPHQHQHTCGLPQTHTGALAPLRWRSFCLFGGVCVWVAIAASSPALGGLLLFSGSLKQATPLSHRRVLSSCLFPQMCAMLPATGPPVARSVVFPLCALHPV